jgi:MFS family permease
MGAIPPLLPFYSPRLGATPFVVGALISVYSRYQLVAGPAVRMLSDRYGRRSALIVSQIGTLAGFMLLASAGNLTLVFLARIIDGMTSGNISVQRAGGAQAGARQDKRRHRNGLAGGVGAVGRPTSRCCMSLVSSK